MTAPVRQQTTYRADAGVANTLSVWVRDETGRHDLSGATSLTVQLFRYGCHDTRTPLATLAATTDDTTGKVTFAIDADTMQRTLPPGLYRFDVIADGADVYPALLEVS